MVKQTSSQWSRDQLSWQGTRSSCFASSGSFQLVCTIWLVPPGSCHLARSTWLVQPGSCQLAHAIWPMPSGPCHLASATWLVPPGPCHLARTTWLVPSGPCHLATATWLVPPGLCHLAHAAWPVPPGSCHLTCATWPGHVTYCWYTIDLKSDRSQVVILFWVVQSFTNRRQSSPYNLFQSDNYLICIYLFFSSTALCSVLFFFLVHSLTNLWASSNHYVIKRWNRIYTTSGQ